MPSSLRLVVQPVLLGLALALPAPGTGQGAFEPVARPYPVAGALPGDQVFPELSVNESGGYVVWQDNTADGDGFGIAARRLNTSLSGDLAAFRINEQGAFDQVYPRVALLQGGGAVFVWQSGRPGFQNIHARFLGADGVFATGDLRVNTDTNSNQVSPDVAVLADGHVMVVWTSFGDASTRKDVKAQAFSPAGQRLGAEFRVNSYEPSSPLPGLNQRSPRVAALANGNFVVAWVTENIGTSSETFESTNAVTASAIVHCRLFNPAGAPLTTDFRASPRDNPFCSGPAVAGLAQGGFIVVWNQRDTVSAENSWDVFGRLFDAAGATNGPPVRLNVATIGDQYAPRVAALGDDALVAWTSLGQDSSFEGVYGRFVAGGVPGANEFLVNTDQVASKQMHPSLAGDGAARFLVAWTSFVGGAGSFDLVAQRYAATRVFTNAPPAPYVYALSSSELGVSWPELAGYPNLECYEVFVDGAPAPVAVTGNYWVLGGLAPGSSHSVRLAYRFADGTRSQLSVSVKATTWGSDHNFDGLPDTWQQMYWGPLPAQWPSPNADSDQDGANNLLEFLSGTHPLDPSSLLRMRLTLTALGGRLAWNSQPGFLYQVQKSLHFDGWSNYGSLRLAAGTTDSVPVEGLNGAEFYRVIRVR